MNSAMENSQKNSQKNNQRPLVIGETDLNVGGSDENRVSHEFRPQKDRFPRSVSEGPQVPIPKAIQNTVQEETGNNDTLVPGSNYVARGVSEGPQVPIPKVVQFPVDARAPDAHIPPVPGIIDHSNDIPDQFRRRSNSKSRKHQIFKLKKKLRYLPKSERQLRTRNPVDYTEGRLPPGLIEEDLFKRCSTPPAKGRRAGDKKSSPILIVSSSGAEPHIQDADTNNPSNEDEEQVHHDDLQDELPHDVQDEPHGSDYMTIIGSVSSHTLLEFASQITQSEGSEADNVANGLSQTCEIPATETQPVSNEEQNANVAFRANSGGELNMVSQPQNFSSDTVYFTASENFAMSDPPVLGQGADGVNNETANGEILNSVENRARDLSEIKDSQFPPVNLPQPFNFLWPVDLFQSISSTMSSEQREALKRCLLARKEQIQAISEWVSRERLEVEERLNNLE